MFTFNSLTKISVTDKPIKLTKIASVSEKMDESLSVDAIKASDGKTYKFLGSQWAELLPSGKTGLFAKKKIGKELDKITGRKVEKISEKRRKNGVDRYFNVIRNNNGRSIFGGGINSISNRVFASVKL